ncbi:MAG: hypothetical protein R3C10_11895 [Pirellulales bacterium]
MSAGQRFGHVASHQPQHTDNAAETKAEKERAKELTIALKEKVPDPKDHEAMETPMRFPETGRDRN